MNTEKSPLCAITIYPETSSSVVYGMYDLLKSVGRDWSFVVDGTVGTSLLDVKLIGATTDSFSLLNGVPTKAEITYSSTDTPDVIIVPEVMIPPGAEVGPEFAPVVQYLKHMCAKGAIIASACSGSLLLAEAGLLDGYDATSHWAYCDTMRRRYPKVHVHGERALVVTGDEHRLVMAGGGTSWLDLALYLIARLTSVERAMEVAKMNLIDWHDVGQQPYARLALTRHSDDAAIRASLEWIAQHVRDSHPVQGMIEASGLPERTFARRFKAAIGMTAIDYVHALRIEDAKQRLESTSDPVEGVSFEVGYEDAAYFSRLFKRSVGLAPAAYRRRFARLREMRPS